MSRNSTCRIFKFTRLLTSALIADNGFLLNGNIKVYSNFRGEGEPVGTPLDMP